MSLHVEAVATGHDTGNWMGERHYYEYRKVTVNGFTLFKIDHSFERENSAGQWAGPDVYKYVCCVYVGERTAVGVCAGSDTTTIAFLRFDSDEPKLHFQTRCRYEDGEATLSLYGTKTTTEQLRGIGIPVSKAVKKEKFLPPRPTVGKVWIDVFLLKDVLEAFNEPSLYRLAWSERTVEGHSLPATASSEELIDLIRTLSKT
ncbi:MAG: hypothetical protein QGF59_15865 [Pirellulaceae bacterium]|jgi:hypothetical protein|nr:hypothetical protein [Pirellulaceae bacterium]